MKSQFTRKHLYHSEPLSLATGFPFIIQLRSSTPSKEEGVFETSIAQSLHKAASADIEAARRKSTLGIITEDKGLHTVEIPDTGDTDHLIQ